MSTGPGPPRRSTLLDVARLARVSPATASRTINGNPQVGDELADRVRRAVETLGYVPDARAQDLRRGGGALVGYLVPDIRDPYYSGAFRALHHALARHACTVISFDSERGEPELERRAVDLVVGAHGRALIAATEVGLREGLVQRLRQHGTRLIHFDNRPAGATCTVTPDDRGGAFILTHHLLEHGHRRVGLVSGPLTGSSALDRHEGYSAALTARGLPLDESLVTGYGWGAEVARDAVLALLRGTDRPTAVVTLDPYAALGALGAVREAGLSVPGDVALATFVDTAFMPYLDPSLTALESVEEPLGALLAELALQADEPIGNHTVPLRLVRRRSCGCG